MHAPPADGIIAPFEQPPFTVANVRDALDGFVQRYVRRFPTLTDRHDPLWPSPCTLGAPDAGGRIAWQPLARAGTQDFAPLERALDVPIHRDIGAYYGAYWSGGLEATAACGHVSLLLLWNEDDALRLIENQIGHALAQRRARAPLAVFFACGAPDTDHVYSVENHTGRVLLEQPGRKPLRFIAPDLATFIAELDPAPPTLAARSD